MSHATPFGQRLELECGYGARLFLTAAIFWLHGWVSQHDRRCSLRHGAQVQERLRRLRADTNFKKVLSLLRRAGAEMKQGQEHGESEVPTMDPAVESESEGEPEREWNRFEFERYEQATMDEVSDDEYWRFIHHGRPEPEEHPRHHREYTDHSLHAMNR